MLFDQGLLASDLGTHASLSITLMDEKVRYSLRVKPDDVSGFGAASGFQLPQRVGGSQLDGDTQIFCLGPDEWLIVAAPNERGKIDAVLERMAAQFVISATEVSHRNVGLILSGSKAGAAVNIGCPLDLSLERFPVGKVVRTVFENAPIMLFRQSEDVFQLEFWRSYGAYVAGLLGRFVQDLKIEEAG